jgi:hypothetical protein
LFAKETTQTDSVANEAVAGFEAEILPLRAGPDGSLKEVIHILAAGKTAMPSQKTRAFVIINSWQGHLVKNHIMQKKGNGRSLKNDIRKAVRHGPNTKENSDCRSIKRFKKLSTFSFDKILIISIIDYMVRWKLQNNYCVKRQSHSAQADRCIHACSM